MKIPHRLINDLGTFASLHEVWLHHPHGGHPGEFFHLGDICYVWDESQRNWLKADYFSSDSFRLLHQTGDLDLTGDLRVGGRAVFQQPVKMKRNLVVEGQLLCRHLHGMDCGLHATYENLVAAHPSPIPGEWALVGSTAQLQLWGCQSSGSWQCLQETVPLGDTFDLTAYDTAKAVVDDLSAQGYVFCGMADPTTNPHRPDSYNTFYLTSQPGVYIHFGGIHVAAFSALMWTHDPSHPDGGEWTACVLLGGVFVQTENIADGAVTAEKLADGCLSPDKVEGLSAVLDQLTTALSNEADDRMEADRDLQRDVRELKETVIRSISINSGQRVYPTDGHVNLLVNGNGGGAASPDTTTVTQLLQGAFAYAGQPLLLPLAAFAEVDDDAIEGRFYGDPTQHVLDIVWDNRRRQALMPHEGRFYTIWSDVPGEMASSDAYTPATSGNFYYMLHEGQLTIYHWNDDVDVNNLVATGTGSDAGVYVASGLSEGDFDIRDEAGCCIAVFRDGHFQVKNFNTAEQPEIRDSHADFAITDEAGYSIVEFAGGHIRTKHFDSSETGSGNTLRVLAIGNSFSYDAYSYVPKLLEEMTGAHVVFGILFKAGCSLQEHWEDYISTNSPYENTSDVSAHYGKYTTTSGAWQQNPTRPTIRAVLESEPWDIILLQQASSLSTDYSTYQPFLNQIISDIATHVSSSVRFGFLLTPALPPDNAGRTIENADADFAATAQVMQTILDETLVDFIIPGGTAIQNARHTTLDHIPTVNNVCGHLNYVGETGIDSHLNEGLPCLVEAYACALQLMVETGRTQKGILGSRFRPTDEWIHALNVIGQQGTSAGVTDANCLLAQKCAVWAVKKPFALTLSIESVASS